MEDAGPSRECPWGLKGRGQWSTTIPIKFKNNIYKTK